MEKEEPSRRGGVKSRRSRSFSGLLGGYPSISQGPRSRSREAEDEEGEESEEIQVAAPDDGADDSIYGTTHSSSFKRESSKAPALKTPPMKEPDFFDGTKAYKLRGFIQTCELTLHNDPESFFSERKKGIYSTSSLTGRARK
ncbi:hypothetical protein O181_034867 [Austropuccinia psidii MF-1]|uniref:Uncharacterized protein n=1 Tax=Austropuccinia psidii MF-1 TaxID=1389203 RepID=A0A9Q3D7I4_9BASI|nr:hypothetical protein [Austropuccinia psidii MF-1]